MTLGAALLVALYSQAPVGLAPESPPTRLRLEVQGPADCTSRADLAARITARSPRIEVADDAPLTARVVITSPRSGNMNADIFIGSSGTNQAPRRVAAHSCAEAADSAALIIAVTLDPTLRRRSSPGRGEPRRTAESTPVPPAPAAVPAPNPPPTPAPISAPPPRRPPAPPVALAAEPTPPTPPTPPIPAAPPRSSRPELGAALGGHTMLGAAPAVLPGVALYLTGAIDRDSPWSPALFLGATHLWRSGLPETGGMASFTMDAVSLDACPMVLRWGLLAARPCASALVGRLAAQGSNTQPQQPSNAVRPFGAAGVALDATWGSRWLLFSRLGLGVTMIRDSYEFAAAPNVFYRAAPVTFSATVGGGVRWP